MKILHQQQGGLLIYTPFIRETPQQTISTASKTSEDKSSNEIEKAIFKVLENNTGLPNDVDLFLSKANSLLVSPPGFDQSYNISDLIKLHSLANKIKHNQTAHANASKRLDTEDAGAEVAITVNGGLYVQDEDGNLKTISAESYYKNSDKYRLLTNTDLINIREYSPSLAYNTSILNDLAGVEGMKSIVEYMKTTINAFGTDTISDKSNRFTVKEKGKIEKGFEFILDGVAPDGIYKVTTTNKITDQGYNKSTNEGLIEAATYLWSTLNPRQKNTIRAHTAAEGLNPNDAKDVYRILISSIQEHTDHGFERSVDVDYDASASKATGLGSEKSEQTTQLTYLEEVANGRATLPQRVDLRNNTSISNISFIGNPYQVLDHAEKPVKTESITNMLLDAQVGQIVDQSSISFGNKVLGIHEKSQVLYDSNSQMYRVNLPYDVSYYNSTGKYKPDLDAQAKFDEFIKWVNSNNPSQIMITQKLQELGLNISYDSSRQEWVFNNNKEFIMMTGITSHRAVDISDKWKGKLSNQEASYLYDYLDEHTDYDEALWNIWGDAASTYKSAIFMPIIDSALATVGTSGEYVPKSYKMDIQNRTRYNNTINNIQTNF